MLVDNECSFQTHRNPKRCLPRFISQALKSPWRQFTLPFNAGVGIELSMNMLKFASVHSDESERNVGFLQKEGKSLVLCCCIPFLFGTWENVALALALAQYALDRMHEGKGDVTACVSL